ncbi:unnamed protein product [marine sediment metagenome]|uniref:Uncharacterized protein n=1 Tax=marine sediment metagenome TaxID=412755 RepID=X1SZQ8_9ZZZZ
MTKMSTRNWAKRELDRASNNLDMTMNHLKNLHEKGYDSVPLIKETIKLSTQMIMEIQNLLEKTKDSI